MPRRPLWLAFLVAVVLMSAIRAEDGPWRLDPAHLIPDTGHEKPVLLFVTAPWTRVCQRFETETLGHAGVRERMQRDYLCARIEAPLPDDLAARYRITRFPAVVFLDRHGGWLRTVEGELPPNRFELLLAAQLPELAEQDQEIAEALADAGDDVAERVKRARLLVEQGLAVKARAHLERLYEQDPDDAQYAGLWAAVERARLGYRSHDVSDGDRWAERVTRLEQRREPLYATDLARERLRALRFAARWDDALAVIAGLLEQDLPEEEQELLQIEAARVLRLAGRESDGVQRLQAVWDTAQGPARGQAEAELERWAFTAGDAARAFRVLRDGRNLVNRYQCAECHRIEPVVTVSVQASCVQCHQKIADSAAVPKDLDAAVRGDPGWYSHVRNVRHYLYAPDLGTVGARLRRDWVRAFLRHPVDIRPFLHEGMPRLPLQDAEIETLLDYLELLAERRVGAPAAEALPAGDVARGEALFASQGCQACHLFGNRVFPESPAASPWPRAVAPNIQHAPNLRWVRDRVRPEALVAWIREPSRFVPGTLMPAQKVTPQELADLIAFLQQGDLGAPAAPAPAPALPAARPGEVRFDEVAEIFLDMCKHCHLTDDQGGIGNTGGGWGYTARGLNLEDPHGPLRGSIGPDGRRRSIVRAASADAWPPLLQRMLWRLDENRWDAWPPYHDPLLPVPQERYDHPPGMPLGLPALTAEELSLLRAWVEQTAGQSGVK